MRRQQARFEHGSGPRLRHGCHHGPALVSGNQDFHAIGSGTFVCEAYSHIVERWFNHKRHRIGKRALPRHDDCIPREYGPVSLGIHERHGDPRRRIRLAHHADAKYIASTDNGHQDQPEVSWHSPLQPHWLGGFAFPAHSSGRLVGLKATSQELAVRIREIAGVAAPERLLCRFHDGGAGTFRLSHHVIDFLLRANVVADGSRTPVLASRRSRATGAGPRLRRRL